MNSDTRRSFSKHRRPVPAPMNGATRRYVSDIKNSTQQVSSSQTVVGAQQYDAFGNLTSSTGSWNGPFSYGGAFGYQTETDTGYQLLGHRYYDPTTGRFLTRDPIGDGRNWYTYCASNPINAADPNGLVSLPIGEVLEWVDFVLAIMNRVRIAILADGVVANVAAYKRLYPKVEIIEGKRRNVNTDCGVFVGHVVRQVDPDFPARGTYFQMKYLEGEGKRKWERVDGPGYVRMPGDISIQSYRDAKGDYHGHVQVEGMQRLNDASWGEHAPEQVPLEHMRRYKSFKKFRLRAKWRTISF